MVSPRAPQPPRISGHQFLRHLGSGGYADVYLYEQATPRRPVAIKVLNEDTLSVVDQQRFLKEANAMAVLSDHPYIVPVFSVGQTDNGRPYIAMKYYPSPSLDVRTKQAPLGIADALAIGIKISAAVETAHRSGILHRDIKPANILTSQYDEPGLTDFGIALHKGELSAESEGLSIPWSPPEVLNASSLPDERADIYSLAATIWHLLVGHSPFFYPSEENTNALLIRRICSLPLPKIPRQDIPPELERVLAVAMSKDPLARPETALELAETLQDVEGSLQLSRTPILIERDTTGHGLSQTTDTISRSDEDRTQLRRIQRVAPQQPSSSFVPPESPARNFQPVGNLATSIRQSFQPSSTSPHDREGIESLETVRRASLQSGEQITTNEASQNTDSTAKSGRNKTLISLAVLVILGAGLAFAFMHKTPATTNVGNQSPAPNLQGATTGPAASSIGMPTVQVTTVSPSSVKISWTYTGQEKGDEYRYRINAGAWVLSRTSSVTVPVNGTQQICAQVQVERSNGSATSAMSSVVCGTP